MTQEKDLTNKLANWSLVTSIICHCYLQYLLWFSTGWGRPMSKSGYYTIWEIGIGFVPVVLGMIAIVRAFRSRHWVKSVPALIGIALGGIYLISLIGYNVEYSNPRTRRSTRIECLIRMRELGISVSN